MNPGHARAWEAFMFMPCHTYILLSGFVRHYKIRLNHNVEGTRLTHRCWLKCPRYHKNHTTYGRKAELTNHHAEM